MGFFLMVPPRGEYWTFNTVVCISGPLLVSFFMTLGHRRSFDFFLLSCTPDDYLWSPQELVLSLELVSWAEYMF